MITTQHNTTQHNTTQYNQDSDISYVDVIQFYQLY